MKGLIDCTIIGMCVFTLAGCVENQDEGLAELDRLALQASGGGDASGAVEPLESGDGAVEIENFEPSQYVEPNSYEPSQPTETTPITTPTREREIPTSQPTQQPRYPVSQDQQQPPIRLRAGVALPQTGPEGILMGFSVDYEFTRDLPQSSSQYRWVIKGKAGVLGAIPIKLKQAGNLATLVNKLRPEQGPFESWIEEKPRSGDVRVISDREPMR